MNERGSGGKGAATSSDVKSLGEGVKGRELQREMGGKALRRGDETLPKKRKDVDYETAAKRLRTGSTLTGTGTGGMSGYQPKTRETKLVWEEFLNNLQVLLADDEQHALRECAEEALAILKNANKKDRSKKQEIQELLDIAVSDEYFLKIIQLSRKLTDYIHTTEEDPDQQMANPEEHGVSVVFDDDEEDDNEDAYMKHAYDQEDENEDEEGEDLRTNVVLHGAQQDDDEDETQQSDFLDAKKIDAYWLQREIGQIDPNETPHETQKRADTILDLLSDESKPDDAVETDMMLQFNYQKFELIKICIKNRWKIVWCTRITRAKGDDRSAIVTQLESLEYGPAILSELEKEVRKGDTEAKAFRQQLRQQQEDGNRNDDKSKNILDLKDLTFEHGSQTMTNTKCALPKGTTRTTGKGYEEIHIPAIKKKPVDTSTLISIKSLPEWAQLGFEGMQYLNPVQSTVYDCCFKRDDNMLLCAPTGAGKTNVAMLTMLREVSKCVEDGEVDEDLLSEMKIVYIAPMKALVQEVVGNFGNRMKKFGIKVSELTGDAQLTKAEMQKSHIIVTTPEKWDIVTRKTGDKANMQQVKLIIMDEIHLLHDTRGPVLEAIISRTIRLIESTQEYTRIVGLSATLPNYEDVATVLRVPKSSDPEKNALFHFDGSFRPVPLQQQYIGLTEKKPLKRRAVMNDIVYKKVMSRAGESQILVFVHSRKDTVATAKAIRDKALENEELGKFLQQDGARREILEEEAERIKDPNLKDLLRYGFGVHHAGLHKEDRITVEALFGAGHLQVLMSTATLAWGVNLPAKTVIIKGTQVYNPEKGRWTELSSLDVMQMIGRAGRPQYTKGGGDEVGEGIIITGQSELQFYLSLLNQQLPIESHFINKLVDQLNAEVVMGTVQNVREAVTWLGYTYLYVRMLRKPGVYGVTREEMEDDPRLEQRRTDLIHTAATQLDKSSLIKYDRKGGVFEATDLGRVCSHYYLTSGTMSKFNEHLKPTMHEMDLFRLFSMADEFKYMSVREEEKMELGKLLEMVPIPVKETKENPLAKINVLLQAYISQLKLEGFALMSDMVYITQSAGRIVRAMFETVVKRGWAELADKILNLAKMVEKRMWLSHSPLRQFKSKHLEEAVLERLERRNLVWDRYYNLTTQDLAGMISNPRSAKTVFKFIHMIPKLVIDTDRTFLLPITRSMARIETCVVADFQFDKKYHGAAEAFHIFIEDPDGERILHHEPFILKEKHVNEEHYLYFNVPIFEPMPPQYFLKIVSDRWLWSEAVVPVSFRGMILPEKSPAHTELHDLKPLPVSALGIPAYEGLYPGIKTLNPIQTQVFHTVYKTADNALICAPVGSGKTMLAEFAFLAMFNEAQGQRVRGVYVAPTDDQVAATHEVWKVKFGEKLGKTVVVLTGDTAIDLKLLESGEIIMTTAKWWDKLSRRWQKRRNITTVKLFVADDLHMLSTIDGPTMEIVVSRMRYISSNTQQDGKKIRIVGLAHSLLHAKDVGMWLGCPSPAVFNFHPSARPTPIEISLRGFDQPGFSTRTISMHKPAYLAVKQQAQGKPVIIFTPSKRVTYDLVIEMLTLCAGDIEPKQFLHCKEQEMEPHMELVKDRLLKKALSYGIGFFDEGMAKTDKAVVGGLFDSSIGAIQIVVAPYTMVYKLSLSAYMVITLGTQYYDGKEYRHVDYNLADMLEMVGRAGRQQHDEQGVALVMCHTPRKAYLKKVLYDPFPVESQLEGFIIDHLNSEIVYKTIEAKQDAVDYLTWTFLYRRLRQNPLFYRMFGLSHEHMSEYLSELVENSIKSLQDAGCITVDEQKTETGEIRENLEEANLGMIAAYYYIQYTTIEIFASSVKEKSKIRELIEILSSATEFAGTVIRHHEDVKLEKLSKHCGIKQADLSFDSPNCKVSLLLHAHFSRKSFAPELMGDLKMLLPQTVPLLYALVDVVGSNRWLTPLLSCMEVCQMVVQGMWDRDSPLLQIPYFTPVLVKKCEAAGVEGIFDLLDMEDADRDKLLGFNNKQMSAVAKACNSYPNIEIVHEVEDADDLHQGTPVVVKVNMTRELDDEDPVPSVYSPLFPQEKKESWWVVIGDKKANYVHVVRRVTVERANKISVEFVAPREGKHSLTLYFMCDSYLGVDQEVPFEIEVKEPLSSDEEESDEMSED
eukprot:TRINITY_DN19848_c0_g1_i1.p1 TRINITY_DN19848_c0_g1~~TRINITY_DN19848_c0_g1_i1.p1  ORF type:complete len:2149 (+),score=712.76 TRINITY_DN19848_c0_g1_i1:40-6486(+)